VRRRLVLIVSGITLALAWFAPAAHADSPSITGFSPAQGTAGTQVAVTGTDFTNATDVQFAGLSASSFTVTDDTDITVTVPSGATSGPISVVTPDGTATSADSFTVIPPQNIVLILTDDQRWDSLQYMPNVESLLVSHGVTFANAFDNNPLCCPTRSTILTGLTSGHNGVWSNSGATDGGFTGFVHNGDQNRQIFGWLHDANYQTALFGKFLNGYDPATVSWVLPGADAWHAFLLDHLNTSKTGCQRGGYYGVCYSNNGVLETTSSSTYSTSTVGNDAVSFIQAADPSRPLFLYFAPRAPHLPTTPEPRYSTACPQVQPLRPPSYNVTIQKSPSYMAWLTALTAKRRARLDTNWVNDCRTLLSVDDKVGRIIQALSDTGRLNNTLILYASDNGFMFGEHRWVGKIVPYEESARVPVVVRDDAVIPSAVQGTTVADQTTSLDYTPTFMQAAGLSRSLDGQSLFPMIGAGGQWFPQDAVLIEHANGDNPDSWVKVPPYCGVRVSGYLYAQYATGEQELYDLAADPFELDNVVADPRYTDVVARLRAQAQALCVPLPPGFSW
jgi:N-acetylglucosamine-6-sulfatase